MGSHSLWCTNSDTNSDKIVVWVHQDLREIRYVILHQLDKLITLHAKILESRYSRHTYYYSSNWRISLSLNCICCCWSTKDFYAQCSQPVDEHWWLLVHGIPFWPLKFPTIQRASSTYIHHNFEVGGNPEYFSTNVYS